MIGFSGTGAAVELQPELGKPEHINFFRDAELAEKRENPEVVAERKREERKQRNELGAGSAESTGVRPWYEKAGPVDKEKQLKQQMKKLRDDPLNEMEIKLDETKKRLFNEPRETSAPKRAKPAELLALETPRESIRSDTKLLAASKQKEKRKSDKKHSKKDKKDKGDRKEKKPRKKSLEQLRQERVRREAGERAKTQALLNPTPAAVVPQGQYSGLSSYAAYTGVRAKH